MAGHWVQLTASATSCAFQSLIPHKLFQYLWVQRENLHGSIYLLKFLSHVGLLQPILVFVSYAPQVLPHTFDKFCDSTQCQPIYHLLKNSKIICLGDMLR